MNSRLRCFYIQQVSQQYEWMWDENEEFLEFWVWGFWRWTATSLVIVLFYSGCADLIHILSISQIQMLRFKNLQVTLQFNVWIVLSDPRFELEEAACCGLCISSFRWVEHLFRSLSMEERECIRLVSGGCSVGVAIGHAKAVQSHVALSSHIRLSLLLSSPWIFFLDKRKY